MIDFLKVLLFSWLMTFFSTNVFGEKYEVIKVISTNAHEGPVCANFQNRLYFTTNPDFSKNIPSFIKYLDLETTKVYFFMKKTNMVNGATLANNGKSLLVAEQGTKTSPASISEINLLTSHKKILINSYHGLPFNSPNDIKQSKETGIIYFTDPDYGYNQGFKLKPKLPNAVYAFNPTTKKVIQLTTRFIMPNGLYFSPDEKILYISDTGAIDGKRPYDVNLPHDVYAAYMKTPYKIEKVVHFARISPGIPDGFITDKDGSLYISAANGIHIYSSEGKLIHIVKLPMAANLTWCKSDIYVMSNTAIYRIHKKKE